MTVKKIFTERAPKPIGPYSQAIVANGFVFCAGQLGIDPKTGRLVGDDFESQTKQALENLFAVLEEARAKSIVFVNIYTVDISQFSVINRIYEEFLKGRGVDVFPARAVVEVSKLPAQGKVEISALAIC